MKSSVVSKKLILSLFCISCCIEIISAQNNTWTLKTNAPDYVMPLAYENDLGWDYKNGVGIVAFGHDLTANTNSVWKYNIGDADFTNLNSSFHRPPKRCGAKMTYDPGTELIYCYGGYTHQLYEHQGYGFIDPDGSSISSNQGGRFLEHETVWGYNTTTDQWYSMRTVFPWPESVFWPGTPGYNNTWTQAYEYGLGLMYSNETIDFEVWAYHAYSNRWIKLTNQGTQKPKITSYYSSTAYDPNNHQLLRVGGREQGGTIETDDENWFFNIGTRTWHQIIAPEKYPLRTDLNWGGGYLTVGYDLRNEAFILVTPNASNVMKFDSIIGWTNLNPTGDIPGGAGCMGAHFKYDPANNQFWLYSANYGSAASLDGNNLYTYKLSDGDENKPYPPEINRTTTNNSVEITWKTPSRGVLPQSYNVYRAEWSNGMPGAYQLIANVNSLAYSDTLTTEEYSYYITSINGTFESSPSFPVYSYPIRPLGVLAIVESNNVVNIAWKENTGTDIVGYNIYRAVGAYPTKSDFTKINNSILSQPCYLDQSINLNDNQIRHYVITALNNLGQESGFSPIAHTVPELPGGPWYNDVTKVIEWHKPMNITADAYTIYYQGVNSDGNPVSQATSTPINVSNYTYTIDSTYAIAGIDILGKPGFHSDIIVEGIFKYDYKNNSDVRIDANIPIDSFWVEVLKNKCVTTSSKAITFNNAGVEIHSYPNPFKNNVTLSFSFSPNIKRGMGSLTILDITGKIIEKVIIPVKPNSTINWQAHKIHNSGIYFFEFEYNSIKTRQKLIRID